MVSGHYRSGIRQFDSHLKRQQEGVIEFAEAQMHRRMVPRPLTERVAHIVFQRRQQIAVWPLQTTHIGGCHFADQIRVFAECLFRAAPAHIPRDIQYRRQPLMAADALRLSADGSRHLFNQIRVPGRAVTERRGKQRRVFAQQPDQALLMKHRRDAEPRLFHQRFLQPVERPHALFRPDDMRAEWAGYLADPGKQAGRQIIFCGGTGEIVAEVAAVAVLAVRREDQPESVHLGIFLFIRHAGQQILYARRDRLRGILIEKRHQNAPYKAWAEPGAGRSSGRALSRFFASWAAISRTYRLLSL